MFRRIEDVEGGPDDPRDFGEWAVGFRKTAKNVLLPLAIFFAVIIVISLISRGIHG